LQAVLSRPASGVELDPTSQVTLEVLRDEDRQIRRRQRQRDQRIEQVEAWNPVPDVRIIRYPVWLPARGWDGKVLMRWASLAVGLIIAIIACVLVWRQRRIRAGGFPVIIRSPASSGELEEGSV
jgi:hypothetical protein